MSDVRANPAPGSVADGILRRPPQGYLPIAEHGMIGDLHTVALVIWYASVVLAGVVPEDDVVALDELRRDRHTAEYEDFASRTITADRVRGALALTGRIVDAVATALARKA